MTESSYQRRFAALERDRRALLDRLAPLDAEVLGRPPGEGEWSVAQVVTHLAGAEERSLAYIRKKTQDPSRLAKAGLGAAMRALALKVALRSPLRFKVPSALPQPENQPWDAARGAWDAARDGWRALLADFPEELSGQAVFKHPRAGYQTLGQALQFMEEHLRHHAKQIDRILAQVA